MRTETITDTNVGITMFEPKEAQLPAVVEWQAKLNEALSSLDLKTKKYNRAKVVIENHPDYQPLRYDTFKQAITLKDDYLTEKDIIAIRDRLFDYSAEVSKDELRDICTLIALRNEFDPRREYLREVYEVHGSSGLGLLDEWLSRVGLTIEPERLPYLRAIGRKYLIQCVARAFIPGCQADGGLFLFDPTGGEGKTKFWRTLAVRREWLNESGPSDINDAAKYGRAIRGFWFVLFDESSSITRADENALKRFWTETQTSFVDKYEKLSTNLLRTCCFGGTTNVREMFIGTGCGFRSKPPTIPG